MKLFPTLITISLLCTPALGKDPAADFDENDFNAVRKVAQETHCQLTDAPPAQPAERKQLAERRAAARSCAVVNLPARPERDDAGSHGWNFSFSSRPCSFGQFPAADDHGHSWPLCRGRLHCQARKAYLADRYRGVTQTYGTLIVAVENRYVIWLTDTCQGFRLPEDSALSI